MYQSLKKAAVFLTAIVFLLCCGCQSSAGGSVGASPNTPTSSSTTVPPAPSTEPIPSTEPAVPLHLDMTATLICPNESNHISTTLIIDGTYPAAGTTGEILNAPIEMTMELGKETDHTFGQVFSPYYYHIPQQSGIDDILYIVAPIYDPETNAATIGIVGLDLENELYIYLFQAYPGRYIVASTDASRTPEEILEHFATFIEYCQK